MDTSDQCLLQDQYTYPTSHQQQPRLPMRPFQVHSDELENCVCETHSAGRKCPYHEALKVAPEERSGTMKAVVESHDLVIGAGQLLLTTRAHTQDEDFQRLDRLRGTVETSEEGDVLEKAAVKLIKAAVLHHGICGHIPLAPLLEFSVRIVKSGLAEDFGPLDAGETAEQRARGLSWLHPVVSAPLVMWLMRTVRTCHSAVQTASVALALLGEEGRNWEPLLDRHGLSACNVELVLRMHQSNAILACLDEDFPRDVKGEIARLLGNNVCRFCEIDLSHPRNTVLYWAITDDYKLTCSLLEKVIHRADERGDYQNGSMARWHLCQTILLGGEGQTFRVARVLKLVKEARTALEQAVEWGVDGPTTPAKELKVYWPCLGWAARCKAAIRAKPRNARSIMHAYKSLDALDEEKRHVKCSQCEKLSHKLLKCGACGLMNYCSKECQVKHWKAGHKQSCGRRGQAPARSEQSGARGYSTEEDCSVSVSSEHGHA